MIDQTSFGKRHSRYGIAALVVSAPIWIYLFLLFLSRHLILAILLMDQCNEQDYGACALKKFFGPLLSLILLIILAIVPLLVYGIGTTLAVIGYRYQDEKKTFAVAALINIAISLVSAFIVLFVWAVIETMK